VKQIAFEDTAFSDFTNWAKNDKKVYKKIISLIKDIDRSPFTGIGKPEALVDIGLEGSLMNID